MDKKVDASGKHPPLEQFFALIFARLGIWTHDVFLHVKGEGKETSFPTYGSHWATVDVTIALSPPPCTSLRLTVQLLYSQRGWRFGAGGWFFTNAFYKLCISRAKIIYIFVYFMLYEHVIWWSHKNWFFSRLTQSVGLEATKTLKKF